MRNLASSASGPGSGDMTHLQAERIAADPVMGEWRRQAAKDAPPDRAGRGMIGRFMQSSRAGSSNRTTGAVETGGFRPPPTPSIGMSPLSSVHDHSTEPLPELRG